jgi:hypothetical protein
MGKTHAAALKYLCFTVLVLFGAPKAGVKIGPIPIYLIDFLIILMLYHLRKLPNLPYRTPYESLVRFILFMILTNEFLNGLRIGTLIQPFYLMVRMSLAVSLFFALPKIVRKPKDLSKIIKYALIGVFITATLLIFSSLPFTRSISAILLSNPILMPNADSLGQSLIEAGSNADRGTSLIGVSILSGAFLNVIWPLLFLLLTFYKPKGILRHLLYITLALIPVGIIMTYSRGAILALLLIVFGMVFFQKGKYRQVVLGLLVITYFGFNFIGFQSELFMFDRIERRTIAALNNPYDDVQESERINAYVEPFGHILKNPLYLFIGEGFARSKVRGSPKLSGGINRADHAVFAKAYYSYGMITSLSLVFLYLFLLNYTFKIIKKTPNSSLFLSKLTRILFVVLIGFSSWFAFGHAAVSQPRGAMLMFFVFGLVTVQRNIYLFEQQKHLDSKKNKV